MWRRGSVCTLWGVGGVRGCCPSRGSSIGEREYWGLWQHMGVWIVEWKRGGEGRLRGGQELQEGGLKRGIRKWERERGKSEGGCRERGGTKGNGERLKHGGIIFKLLNGFAWLAHLILPAALWSRLCTVVFPILQMRKLRWRKVNFLQGHTACKCCTEILTQAFWLQGVGAPRLPVK